MFKKISQDYHNKYHYILHFDGASKGNPGQSGAGAVIYQISNTSTSKKLKDLENTDYVKKENEYFTTFYYIGDKETNNVAEYYGVLIGLYAAIRLGIKNLLVKGDSQIIIKQMSGIFRVNKPNLIPLNKRGMEYKKTFNKIYFQWVDRDNNSKADQLANLSITKWNENKK